MGDGSGIFGCDTVPGMSSNMMDCDDADAVITRHPKSVTALTMVTV